MASIKKLILFIIKYLKSSKHAEFIIFFFAEYLKYISIMLSKVSKSIKYSIFWLFYSWIIIDLNNLKKYLFL